MQNTSTTPSNHPTTLLGRIGIDPSRPMSVREWWHEVGEPVEMLDDPEATFAEGERGLIKLCLANSIAYRPAGDGAAAAFPAWLMLRFYPANP